VLEEGLYGSSASVTGPLHRAKYAVDMRPPPPSHGLLSNPWVFFKLFSEKSQDSDGKRYDSREP